MRLSLMLTLSVALCLSLGLAGYLALPLVTTPTLPIHWNAQGQADGFAPARTVIYAFPVIAATISLAFAVAAPKSPTGRLSAGLVVIWTIALLVVAALDLLMLLSAL